jgi:hypothetical protein
MLLNLEHVSRCVRLMVSFVWVLRSQRTSIGRQTVWEVICTAHRCRHALELFSLGGIRVVRFQKLHQANAMRSRAHHSAKATKRDAYIAEAEFYVRSKTPIEMAEPRICSAAPSKGSPALRAEDPS